MTEPITFAIVAAVAASALVAIDRNSRLNERVSVWIARVVFRNSQRSGEVAARAYFVARGAIFMFCLFAVVGALIYYFGG